MEAKQAELAAIYHGLNPVLLLKEVNQNLECLWKLAERSAGLGNRNFEATRCVDKLLCLSYTIAL